MSNASETKGHRANAPGLRGHSCGDLYPYTLVGTNFGKSWYVLNALTGGKSHNVRSQRAAERIAQQNVGLAQLEALLAQLEARLKKLRFYRGPRIDPQLLKGVQS